MEFFLLLHLEILKIIYTKMNPALPATRKQKILRETKDYLMIALGMIMYGIGWTVFLLPSDIPSGAVPGIASIVYWGTGFPVQYTYLIINFLLLLLALLPLSKVHSFRLLPVLAGSLPVFFLPFRHRLEPV